jgi:ribosomal protein S18 acetylase RimI-like enzyme
VATLRAAEPDVRELLRQLLADYLFEFDGQTEPYRYFDAYWREPERRPFLIDGDGEIAGFCLIRTLDDCWNIAEFSVLPEKRGGGLGRSAVENLAARAHAAGATQLKANVQADKPAALAFWLAAGFVIVREGDPVVTRRAV